MGDPYGNAGFPTEGCARVAPRARRNADGGTASRRPSRGGAVGCEDSRHLCPRSHRRHPSGQGMNPRPLRRALPKAWASLGRIRWPAEPQAEKRPRSARPSGSGSPGSGPPTPRSPRRSSACARQTLRNIPHDSSISVPESRPAPQREDARVRPDRSPLSPCAHADPPQTVWSRRLGALPRGGSVAARSALPRPGPIAAAGTLPPPQLQLLPRRGPSRVRRGSAALARSGAPGPHKASARALSCLRRVQSRAGSCRRGCCADCSEEQDLSSGLQFMNRFLRLRFVL